MIYSVGIDLIELERVSNALDKWGDKFARRILGEEERILYREKKNKVQFLAGRFAAKEAVMKSLGTFLIPGYTCVISRSLTTFTANHMFISTTGFVKKLSTKK